MSKMKSEIDWAIYLTDFSRGQIALKRAHKHPKVNLLGKRFVKTRG
jgi:hypothetical protein